MEVLQEEELRGEGEAVAVDGAAEVVFALGGDDPVIAADAGEGFEGGCGEDGGEEGVGGWDSVEEAI